MVTVVTAVAFLWRYMIRSELPEIRGFTPHIRRLCAHAHVRTNTRAHSHARALARVRNRMLSLALSLALSLSLSLSFFLMYVEFVQN